MNNQLLEQVLEIAAAAGRAAMEHYGSDAPVEYKEDNSPLTLADKAAHFVIVNSLQVLDPWLPVLSEESDKDEIADRKSWHDFWVVDPLDGSKEFIKQSGQFTVNIARVQGDEPVLGVVYAPATGEYYYAARGDGAFAIRADGSVDEIIVSPADPPGLRIVASKDHAGPQVEALLERLDGAECVSMGSSLKFCLVAEGAADFYPRLVPTMEWDTAAAQCILETAGGYLVDLSGRRLLYNKDDLRNPSVLAYGDDSMDWRALLEED